MLYPSRQHRPSRPAPISLLLLLALLAALGGGIVATPLRPPMSDGLRDPSFGAGQFLPAPPPAGTISFGAVLTPDPQTGGLRLLAQEVDGDLRVITDLPLTVAGDLRAGGILELRAPRLSITASLEAARIDLRTTGLLDLATGQTITARTGQDGGQIRLAGDALVLAGALDTAGAVGGSITLGGRQIIQAASASAAGISGAGGSIAIQTTSGYVGTTAATLDVRGARAGGSLRVDSGAGRLFSSALMRADGQIGGSLLLLGQDIALVDASLDASGAAGGGDVLVGRLPLAWPWLSLTPATAKLRISPSTRIRADATDSGDGGRILVWSDEETVTDGSLSARGGTHGGGGGTVEISGRVNLAGRAEVRADAPTGPVGHIRFDPKNITIGGTSEFPQFDLLNPTPSTDDLFGYIDDGSGTPITGTVIPLSTGNVLVLDSGDDAVAVNAGAVYLFNGVTGALISTLTGSSADDHVGSLDAASGTSGVLILGNGNVVLRSPLWDNAAATDAGAVTWFSGTVGVSGVIAEGNSLVGSTADDTLGGTSSDSGVVALNGGNYVVASPLWDDSGASPAPLVDAGAATWGSDTTGVSGVITAGNSLVGTHSNDSVGSGITPLRNGSYVVRSPSWDSVSTDVGAVTWGSAASGVKGAVTLDNSLVGETASDQVGVDGVVALANGNYVVRSSVWDNGSAMDAGAATWCDGTSATAEVVTAGNSLVGTTAGDKVGASAYALSNGNYVLITSAWDNGALKDVGAVTWGDGVVGIVGEIAPANSIIGTSASDSVGSLGIVELSNGSAVNYVVRSPIWNNGAIIDAGAVTWARGDAATSLIVSASNSLVGSSTGDTANSSITPLRNGNYVLACPLWDSGADTDAGAVILGDGTLGDAGSISQTNALVGSSASDNVGNTVVVLHNQSFVVASPLWDDGATTDAGAVTWSSGEIGNPSRVAVTGAITAANSLVGTQADDQAGFDGVVALAQGNYVVLSSLWDNGASADAGAATWGSEDGGVSGVISAANSLVGTQANDQVGGGGAAALANGNYVARSPNWSNAAEASAGAATWASGASGVSGAISAANSLVGSNANDSVGISVLALSSGNYVVATSTWDNGAAVDVGAATWASGASGVTGVITMTNSLVGTRADDQVASTINPLGGDRYLVISPLWDSGTTKDAGAVTLSSGATGISGAVSAQNSVVGRKAFSVADALAKQPTDGSFYVNFASHDRVAVGLPSLSMLFTYACGQASSATLSATSLSDTLAGGAHVAVTLQANNDITISNAITVNNPADVGGAVIVQAGRSLIINASITTDGAPLTLIANDLLASGVINSQRDTGVGSITMASSAAINAGTANVTVDLRNGAGKTNAAYGGVTLDQVTGNLHIVGGTLTPAGDVIGITTVVGGLRLSGGLSVNVEGTETTQADHVEVTGPVSLAGPLLISVGRTYTPVRNDLVVLIHNDGRDAVIGTFSGLPESSIYIVGGVPMTISYKGGDGNDVVLLAVDTNVYLPLIRR